ncbi:MAG TPA: LysM peptidoglycan-binding domain-containing protein, partial [Albitalea sp.]|nr:LysM peptidoglycan-binding domain-containing protein [Albitalea sp.]
MNTTLCACMAVAVLALAGCASPRNHAPVEDRAAAGKAVGAGTVPAETPADASKPLPGAENAGKAGYYSVKQGDTLIRIGLETGQNWKDLIKWNNLDNPNVIEVGQVLRVVAPGTDAAAAGTKPVAQSKVEVRPLGNATAASGAAPAAPTPMASAAAAAPTPPPATAREADDDINWIWPANGPVVSTFDETRSKGLAISGKPGDPVLAAADGRVVYAGSGLRGYG